MTDHYIGYLVHALTVARADARAQQDRAEVLQRTLDAILDAHSGCTAQTCTTIRAAEGAL